MSDKGVTDEMLMSYVDGELDEASAAAVERAVQADPGLATRMDAFRRSRTATRDAFARLLSEPAPDRLVDSVLGSAPIGASNVVAFSPRPRLVQAAMAMAATLVVAAGVGGYWYGQTVGGGAGAPAVALLDGHPALLAALDEVPGGEARNLDGGALALQETYRIDGGVCRSFTLAGGDGGVRGLACNRGAGWNVDMAVADGGAGTGTFSPASDRAAFALDAYLDGLEAGGALGGAEEAELRERGWRD